MMNPRVISTLLLLGLPVVHAQTAPSSGVAEIVAAAERGGAEVQFQLARAYLHGEGVPKNTDKAFELMKAAADQGHADAIGGLGYFYSVGLVVEKDPKLAAGFFRKGAEKGSAKAMLNLGKLLLDGSDGTAKATDEGLKWIKQAADQNLPEAALAHGMIFYYGDHGVAKDPEQAARYIKVAAELGLADARNFMGVMYQFGTGVPVDQSLAEQWFRKAALQGYVKAQSNLGQLLGPLADKRETRIESLAWLSIAADQGDVPARKNLRDSMPGLKKGEMEAATIRAAELRKLVAK